VCLEKSGRALRVENIELFPDARFGLIHVEHSWDRKEGQIDTKSIAGVRTIPICEPLYDVLSEHLAGRESGLAFGEGETPWGYWAVRDRAERNWKDDYRFHEARHSFSTFLDAAGISNTRADRYMGHSDNSTPGRYRHQLELELVDDAKALSAYLARAVSPLEGAHQLRTSCAPVSTSPHRSRPITTAPRRSPRKGAFLLQPCGIRLN
jgi:integrase